MTDKLDDIPWNADIRYAYGTYEILLSMMGIWPYTCHRISAIIMFTIACTTEITMMIFIFGEAIVSNTEMNLQMLSIVSCSFIACMKTVTIRVYWRKYEQLLRHLTAAWNIVKEEILLKRMKYLAKLGKNVCMVQLGSTWFVCLPTIFIALPIFSPPPNVTINDTSPIYRSLPLQTPHLFPNISSGVYAFLFIYQCVQLFFTPLGNVGNDGYFFGMSMNLTAQLECLAFDLEHITENEDESSRQKLFSSYIGKQVKLIELAESLETTFCFDILVIVAINCSQICLYGLVVLKSARSGDIVLLSNAVICMTILILQIFMYSYAGECLAASIENLGNAIYKCLWYEMTLNDRKNLILVILRTRRIFSLTAGKVYRMDLDSFKSIVKAIGSYFSVMQAMFEE